MSSLTNELQQCPLFAKLNPTDLDKLAGACRPIKRQAEELIFREGDPVEGFYIVIEGMARVYKLSPDGRERILHMVRPPHSFAEAALFGQQGYPAFASAMVDSRLILVSREAFLRMLRERPDAAIHMFQSMSTWMHRLLDQLENETFLSARAKLASYILRELHRRPEPGVAASIQLGQAKKAIASQLGMAPETFSRGQADLEAAGLIRVDGRRIEILDLTGLEGVVLGEGA